ncbi:MAG: deoxyribodipyrimidine photolyase [Myxococcaceae bacterium]|nr:deoxyribodipyrimidine photolyase [Myxococcaceae bacterium]
MAVPEVRLRALNDRPLQPRRRWVLYWMTSFRRTRFNFALDRAIEHAKALGKPLLVLEALRVGYPDSNDRLHTFILEGMAENARRFAKAPVLHVPYVEETAGDGAGLLEALAAEACVVVGDDWPCYFVPRMQAAAASRLDVRLELVDSNGLWPMRATDRVFTTAHSFRAHLQKALPPHLTLPADAPLARLDLPTTTLPAAIARRWGRAPKDLLEARPAAIAALPIDHSVPPGVMRGGSHVAEARLSLFVSKRLADYPVARNEPEQDGTSALSPYLHFGHVSAHHVFAEVARYERWTPDLLGRSIGGSKSGWWKMSPAAEAFLDELVTWRELAYNLCALRPDDYGSLATLPAFAKATLKKHEKDPRPHLYSDEQLERAETHDPLWNATQRQLVRDGWFHNYLRMLWGKKILEWSPSAKHALERMERLMNRYSLDGRDPCSYAGYLWVLGRCDRAWGPERPIFGSVRYMSSENTARKISVKGFLAKYAAR